MISKKRLIYLNRMEVNNYLAQFRSMKQGVSGDVPEDFNASDEFLSFEAQKFDEINKMFQAENASLRARLKNVVDELAEQKVLISRLLNRAQEVSELPVDVKFPIDSEEELGKLNETINHSNREAYIKTMNIIIKPKGILKSMKYILTDRGIMEFNLSGVQGKKSLKQYTNFYGPLLTAIPTSESSGPAELQLRDAIRIPKNRVFQSHTLERKKRYREKLRS